MRVQLPPPAPPFSSRGKSGAFTIEYQNIRKQFEGEYSKTAPLYYRGQIPLDTILARIQKDLARL
jgi:hypothetical protein